jgi:hypothetical protein
MERAAPEAADGSQMRLVASTGSPGDWIARGLLAAALAGVFASIIVGHYRKRAKRRRQGLPADDPSEGSIWEIFVPLLWIISAIGAMVLSAYVGSYFGGSLGRRVGAISGAVAALFVGVFLLYRKLSPGGGARELFAGFFFLLSVPAGEGAGLYVKSAGFGPELIWLGAVCGLLVVCLPGFALLLLPVSPRGRARTGRRGAPRP